MVVSDSDDLMQNALASPLKETRVDFPTVLLLWRGVNDDETDTVEHTNIYGGEHEQSELRTMLDWTSTTLSSKSKG